MKKLIVIGLLFYACSAQAQERMNNVPQKPHAIYGNVGFLLGPNISINYEQILRPFKRNENNLLYYRGGIGYMTQYFGEYVYLAAQLGMITAAHKNHHFDLAGGIFLNQSIDDRFLENTLIPITITVAYRYQWPDSNGYFKIGGGLLEGFQISGGVRF